MNVSAAKTEHLGTSRNFSDLATYQALGRAWALFPIGARMYASIGGFSFWAPSLLLHWLRGSRFLGSDALSLTVLLPITTAMVLATVWKRRLRTENRLPAALLALLGIWLFGPLMMSVGWTFGGGGMSVGWRFVLLGTCLFPVFTFIMSTYDGTSGALLLATALLPFLPKLRFKFKSAFNI